MRHYNERLYSPDCEIGGRENQDEMENIAIDRDDEIVGDCQ